MLGHFPGVDFLGFALKFKKREKISSSLVCFLHKMLIRPFFHGSRAVTARKCIKKRDARGSLLFGLNLSLF